MTREYNDRVIQTKVSSLTLANAMLFLKSKGVIVNNQSRVLRRMLEMCANIAENDPNIKTVTDHNEALEIINSLGQSNMNECSEAMRNYNGEEAKINIDKLMKLVEEATR